MNLKKIVYLSSFMPGVSLTSYYAANTYTELTSPVDTQSLSEDHTGLPKTNSITAGESLRVCRSDSVLMGLIFLMSVLWWIGALKKKRLECLLCKKLTFYKGDIMCS